MCGEEKRELDKVGTHQIYLFSLPSWNSDLPSTSRSSPFPTFLPQCLPENSYISLKD